MDIRALLAGARRLIPPFIILSALVVTVASPAAAGRLVAKASPAARGARTRGSSLLTGDLASAQRDRSEVLGRGRGRLYMGGRPDIKVRMRVEGDRLAYSVSAKLVCFEKVERDSPKLRRFVTRGGFSLGNHFTEPIGPDGRFTKREMDSFSDHVMHAQITADRITGTYRESYVEENSRDESYKCGTRGGTGRPISFVARRAD